MQANEIRHKKNVDIRRSKGYTDVATQFYIIPESIGVYFYLGKNACFADLIMMINNSNSTLKKDINLTAFELYNKHYGAIEKILKTTDEWKKSITTADKELEIKGFFTDPDYKLSEGTEAILRKILQEGFDENADSIKKIFNELNKANDIVDYM